MDLIISIPKENFISYCIERITQREQPLEKSVCEAVQFVIHESLKNYSFVSKASFRYRDQYSKCLSLNEYIALGFISLWHFDMSIDLKDMEQLTDFTLVLPEYIFYGDPDIYPHQKLSKKIPLIDTKKLKTKTKCMFSLSPISVKEDTLILIYNNLPDDLNFLLPSSFLPAGDWRQTFYNIKTGETFFCSCFEEAIKNNPEPSVSFRKIHPHIKYALDQNSFLPGICHICRKIIPQLGGVFHNKKFVFSRVYGAYIHKIMYQYNREISFHEAENILRKILDYPLIGEGWESETALYKRIKSEFSKVEIIHHGRPPFLGRQEYDIWIPEYSIAIEYQGIQHYEPIEHWGGEEGLRKRQELDKKKMELSKQNGVTLLCVREDHDYNLLAEKIKQLMNEKSKQTLERC